MGEEITVSWKKRVLKILTVPIFAAAIGGAIKAEAKNSSNDPLRAVIFYQAQIWVQDINIMQQIAQSMQKELEGYPEVALSCYGTENMSMTDAMKAAVNMKTDVMICYGVNSEEAMEGYRNLTEHGIRFILADGDVEESHRFSYIGTDNKGAGRQAADLIAQEKGKDCSVAVLAPGMKTSLRSVGARLEGFESGAEENGLQIEAYCETSYDSLTAIERIEVLLEEHPGLEVLFCAEAVSGQAAADVIGEMGLEEQIMVVTYDTNQSIEEDLHSAAIDVTLIQDTEAIGKACAQQLIAIAADRELETGRDVLFECVPMTAEDLEGETGDES